ncbi:PTPA-CTERM sorting domain-containing protein [Leptothermofonsia sp. ETS-13]|uniref:PTPA-CTERM sorting domain-containing protein n=1 Tax=Leptothermofonsia sp. ETS-13 TaxID=3035696 RepID=UPI003BA07FFB
MNLKTLGISAAVATTVVAGSAMSLSPAQAATLTPGTINLDSNAVIASSADSGATVTLNLSGFDIAAVTGGFVGLSGPPTVLSLTLTRGALISGTTFEYTTTLPVNNFISDLFLGGDEVFVDIINATFSGRFTSSSDFSFLGDLIQTRFRSTNQLPGGGVLQSFTLTNNSSSIDLVAIPTPALLPGLIGLGLGVLRKRKSEGAEEVSEA